METRQITVMYITSLHSNLVLFKYYPYRRAFIRTIDFTFQSGSIQMVQVSAVRWEDLPLHSNLVLFKFCDFHSHRLQAYTFTFQSGSIQMHPYFPYSYPLFPLHSNLVLFKSPHM